jgi:hypothetical protein
MTPTQKARALVERFYLALPNNGSQTGINNVHSRWEEGKQCALMAVDEIITALKIADITAMDGSWYVNEWTEVQAEIEKI